VWLLTLHENEQAKLRTQKHPLIHIQMQNFGLLN